MVQATGEGLFASRSAFLGITEVIIEDESVGILHTKHNMCYDSEYA